MAAEEPRPVVCLTPWVANIIQGSRDIQCETCEAHGALSPETEKRVEELKGKHVPRYLCVNCFVKELQTMEITHVDPPSEGQLRELNESRPDLN